METRLLRRPAPLYALIGLLMAGAVAYQAASTRDTLLDLRGTRQLVRAPIGFDLRDLTEDGRVIASVNPEAERAGIQVGDRLVAIEGTRATGRAAMARALDRARPSDFLSLRLVREEGSAAATLDLRVELQARENRPTGAASWLPAIVRSIAMPWLCLLLGGWVVLARPSDFRAWLLFAMMATFSQATSSAPAHWPGLAGVIGVFWQDIAQVVWSAAMLLFAVHFPERLAFDVRFPWAKWLLAGPLLALALLFATIAAASLHRQAAVIALERGLSGAHGIAMVLAMACIGSFFAILGFKWGTLPGADARRRVRVLMVGANVSLAPTLFLVVPGILKGVGPAHVTSPGLTACVFSFLFLFPVTLAYVIVVQRALDVRVVIRQGMQYALARGGVTILRNLIWIGIIAGVTLLVVRPGARSVEIVRGIATGGLLLVITRRGSERLLGWTDRRFFREACNAERILADLGERVVTMVDPGAILDAIARQIADALHTPRVACFIEDPSGRFRIERAVGLTDAGSVPAFDARSATIAHLRRERGPVRVYLEDAASWTNRAGGLQAGERPILKSIGTQLLIPIPGKEKLAGMISLGPKLSEEAYSATDLRLLRGVATQAGLALENSRLAAAVVAEAAHRERLNREVEIAREVQERLFPQRLPTVSGVDFGGACRPALGVGGDYYDFIALPGGGLGLAIADVSGKGIGAALLMASLQASLRGQTIAATGGVARILSDVNRLVFDASPDNRYATFFYARYDPRTRDLTYVNAGHCPPMLLRDGGRQVIRLAAGGTVIGLFENASWTEETVRLSPGDYLVAYSDGISEAFNGDDEEFGEGRLMTAAAACLSLDAAAAVARLLAATDAFVAGAPQSDDMTIVVLRVLARE